MPAPLYHFKNYLPNGLFPILDIDLAPKIPLESLIEGFMKNDLSLFIVRQKMWAEETFVKHLSTLQRLKEKMGFNFIIHHHGHLAEKFDSIGVHLTAAVGLAKDTPQKIPRQLYGVSAHSLADCLMAEAQQYNYVFLGSVFPTPKEKSHPVLGVSLVEEVTRRISIPVYAIGGIDHLNVSAVKHSGCRGFSCLRAVYHPHSAWQQNLQKLNALWHD